MIELLVGPVDLDGYLPKWWVCRSCDTVLTHFKHRIWAETMFDLLLLGEEHVCGGGE
jgi:hypothetical protein